MHHTHTLGRYQLLRPLGEGGQGRVVEAIRHGPGPLRTAVALKLLTRRGHDLAREARLGSLLRHPHLVDVYEVGELDGTSFCAMELCDGALSEHLPLPPRAVIEAALQVCDALAYAHDALELVHQDLKPSNLLVHDGVVKVADLGIARARGFDHDGVARGTPRFMAPEQQLGLPIDARTDIYALGRVLVTLASGHDGAAATVPLDGEMPDDQPPDPVAWLEPVLARCLAPLPEERFGSMQELARALADLPRRGPGLAEHLGRRPPEPDPPSPLGNLGDATRPLLGRDDLLDRIRAALEEPGLVTLKGTGGIGKSHVARHAARRHRDQRGHPAWILDLGDAPGREDLVRRAASVLDVPRETGLDARGIGRALAGRGPLVLVLDNGELLAHHRDVLTDWCAQAPDLRLLVTSRVPVAIPEERLIEVGPLSAAASTALVVARARSRGVDPTDDPDLPALIERLDGLPLALELAAGRLGVLSVGEVSARLGAMLRSGEASVPRRQATLSATLAWSWDRLPVAERHALAQLSVFRGGFTPDDAAAVLRLPDGRRSLDALDTLAEHSLLTAGASRLGLLLPVREDAETRLAALSGAEDVALRHAHWMARHGRHDLLAPGPLRLSGEHVPNLQIALERSLQLDRLDLAAPLARALAERLRAHGPLPEGLRVLDRVLPRLPPDASATLWALRGALAADTGDQEQAERDLERASLTDEPALRALVEHERGCRLVLLGQYQDAIETLKRAVEHQVAQGRTAERSLLALGAAQRRAGQLDDAATTTRRAFAAFARSGDRTRQCRALGNLGTIALQQGELDRATALHRWALEISQSLRSRREEASDRANLGIVAAYRDDLDTARAQLEAAHRLFREAGMRPAEAEQLGNLAELAITSGHRDEARRRATETLRLRKALGNDDHVGMMELLLGRLAHLDGDLEHAQRHLERALVLQHHNPLRAGQVLIRLARLHLELGAAHEALGLCDRAVTLLAAVPHLEGVALAVRGEARWALGDEGGRRDLQQAVALLRPLGVAAALREALCCAARASSDPGPLTEAEDLGRVPEHSEAHHDLVRTRRQLTGP